MNTWIANAEMEHESEVKAALLEAQVEASFQGHDLGPFEEVTNTIAGGYQARCRRCDQSTWISGKGLRYSLLEERCKGEEVTK